MEAPVARKEAAGGKALTPAVVSRELVPARRASRARARTRWISRQAAGSNSRSGATATRAIAAVTNRTSRRVRRSAPCRVASMAAGRGSSAPQRDTCGLCSGSTKPSCELKTSLLCSSQSPFCWHRNLQNSQLKDHFFGTFTPHHV